MEGDPDRALRERLAEVRGRIGEAARRAGRPAAAVRLMGVTKTLPRAALEAAVRCGLLLFGENRVQEAAEKLPGLADGVEVHLIGHLQRNKARPAARLFACVQSIDRLETALALDRACREAGRSMEVLLEVNTSGEESKAGFRREEDLLAALDAILADTRLAVRGLMTVGPLTADPDPVRRAFARLRGLHRRLGERLGPAGAGLAAFDTLSMGMSSDYELAVEEGATLVRIGTALFGPRPAPETGRGA